MIETHWETERPNTLAVVSRKAVCYLSDAYFKRPKAVASVRARMGRMVRVPCYSSWLAVVCAKNGALISDITSLLWWHRQFEKGRTTPYKICDFWIYYTELSSLGCGWSDSTFASSKHELRLLDTNLCSSVHRADGRTFRLDRLKQTWQSLTFSMSLSIHGL